MIILLGAGGHAANILDILMMKYPDRHAIQVFDDNPDRILIHNRVIGSIDKSLLIADSRYEMFVVGMGDNTLREKLTLELMNSSQSISACVNHPNSIISEFASIGKGSVVMAGAIIQARAQIGYGVIINTGATVDHDCIIYDFAHICPGVNLAGNVTIGERTMIGIGSTVIQGAKIGPDITVGAGSVVIEDLQVPGTYVGCPAKLIKERKIKC